MSSSQVPPHRQQRQPGLQPGVRVLRVVPLEEQLEGEGADAEGRIGPAPTAPGQGGGAGGGHAEVMILMKQVAT